jgi:hypothetical protein
MTSTAKRFFFRALILISIGLNTFCFAQPTLKSGIEAQDIHWTPCGPVTKATEGQTGGKAIPHFATGRGNGIGRINSLHLHPKFQHLIFAASITGGLFVSRNNGLSWSVAGTDQLKSSGVGAFAPHARKANSWVMANGDHENLNSASSDIWLTSDGGRSYQSLANPLHAGGLPLFNKDEHSEKPFFIREILWQCAKENFIWLVTNQGIWRSNNLRINRKGRLEEPPQWALIKEGDFFDLQINKNGRRMEWVASSDKIWHSDDQGAHWTALAENGFSAQLFKINRRMTFHSHKNLPNFLYVSVTSSTSADGTGDNISALYLVDTKRGHWQPLHIRNLVEPGLSNLRPRAWDVHPNDPNKLVMADVQPVYFSVNGGKEFKKSVGNLMHDDTHQLRYTSDGKYLFAAHDGGVSMSSDGGLHWVDRSSGLACTNVFGLACLSAKSDHLIYTGYDTGVNVLVDSSHLHMIWGDGFDCDFLPSTGEVVATIQDGMFFKADSNLVFDSGKHPNAKSDWRTHMCVHPTIDQCIFIAGKRLMRSLDAGENWASVMDVKFDSTLRLIHDVFVSDFDKSTAIACGLTREHDEQAKLYISHDILNPNSAAINWEQLPDVPGSGSVIALVFHPVQRRQFWMLKSTSKSAGKLWFFDGQKFSDVSSNLGSATCESMIVNKTTFTLIIGSDIGVFCKDLHQVDFKCYTGYPGCEVKAMDINDQQQQLYIGTFGRGIWRCNLSDLKTK